MLVELKKVKINSQMSEETTCFSADLWIDGKKAGTVSNRGQGGQNDINIADRQLFKTFDMFCLSQPPLPPDESFNRELKMDMDLYVSLLVGKYQEDQLMKRRCKTTTFFRIKSQKYADGEWNTVKAPYSVEVKKFLVTKYGGDLGLIANERFSPLPSLATT